MPSFKESELSDVTTGNPDAQARLHSSSRRRVWVAPHVTSHAAIILTGNTLYLVSGTTPPSPEIVQAIHNGADPVDYFGQMVIVVSLSSIRLVSHDLLTNSIHLETQAGSGSTGVWSSRSTIVFTNSESADSLFAKLWRRLGTQFKLRQDRPSMAQWIPTPLAAVAGIILTTLVLILLVNYLSDLGTSLPSGLAFVKSIQWRWIAVTGGTLAAVVQVWIYRRATQPPVRLELVEEK
ncbi:MAG: hypothetical protein U0798_15705 [Gemmataceae bacterium]